MHILYIEDDASDAQLVKRYVAVTPHQIEVVDAIQDINAIAAHQPDLMLMDMLIKGERQGYALVTALRECGYTKPIVALTALTTAFDRQQAFNAGVNEILSKPFTIEQLADLIARYTA
jgi:two-component system capsular synthesis sensor histidine kinase RcsC